MGSERVVPYQKSSMQMRFNKVHIWRMWWINVIASLKRLLYPRWCNITPATAVRPLLTSGALLPSLVPKVLIACVVQWFDEVR